MTGRGAALIRATGALTSLLVLTLGVPYLLVSTVGNPFPASVPSVDEVRILLTQNGQGFTNFLIGALAILVWIIWLQLMLALIVEIVATVRQRETRRLPVIPGMQSFAARLIAALTLATALAAGPLVAPAVGALNFHDSVPSSPVAQVVVENSHQQVVELQPSEFDAVSEHPAVAVTVADHTELWDLAEAAYGDGVSWKLIAQANAGIADAAGVMITAETEAVAPGTELQLPGEIDASAMAQFGSVASDVQAATTTSEPDASLSAATMVVQPGDSMWSAAEAEVEHRLGRPGTEAEVADYWFEVVAANEDVSSGDRDLIYPGESLVMPGTTAATVAEAPTPAPDELADQAESVSSVVAAELDELADQAESVSSVVAAELDELADRAEWAETAQAPAAATERVPLVDGLAASITAMVDAGDGSVDLDTTLPTPADQVPTASGQVAPDPAALDPAAVDPSAVDELPADTADGVDTTPGQSISIPAVGMSALGAALLGAGVVSAVRRRRDRQRRTRPVGTLPRPASPEAAAFEAAIAHMADEVSESQVGLGWRVLPASAVPALGPAARESEVEAPGGLHASPAVIADAARATADAVTVSPGEPVHDESWLGDEPTIDSEDPVAVEVTSDNVVHPQPENATAPSSVTIIVGTDPATGEAVLFDLAATRSLAVRGSARDSRSFARSTVLDLAVSDRSDDVHVIAVGIAAELDDLERVHVVDSYDEASALALRMGWLAADSATPLVVVGAASSSDATLVTFHEAGVLVVAPDVSASVWIDIDGPHGVLQPEGRAVELAALSDQQYRSVAELIDSTSGIALEIVDETVEVHEVIDVVAVTNCPVQAGPREVKVLGPVEVAGVESFSSLKAIDVVAYLAFHRHGVDADQIKTWVWPTFDPPTDKAFANVMSRARTGLGADEDGSPYLSRAGSDKTYRLAEAVTTDFDRFRALADLAEQQADATGRLDLYRQALELIRGIPFSGGAASSFSWADNHVRAQVEYTIDEAVHRCADLALEADDLATARWAALKGLELVPGCEQCFRRRFLIARAGNNRSELRRAMADLEASAMIDLGEPEALDTISGDLLDLYHELDRALVGRAS